ncbi:MAG: M20/M25/M40 family metallo-hydrolase [Myxococcales bacterium]|nr:M20/M25/M40 family metallo-hydrolase [Myxococcales bacterium]
MDEASQWLSHQLPAMEAALGTLVDLNSFTGNRDGGRRVGELLVEVLRMPGLAVEVVDSARFAPHLVFRSEGRADAQPVGLLGHLDTVFPPGTFEGYRVDGALRRGPGVFDMKGGLVVVAWALKALAATGGLGRLPPVRVVVVSDEEDGSPEGASVIHRALAGCGAALDFEPGRSNDAVVTQRSGTGSVKVLARGKAAHAGNAYWEGANAIWALARFVDRAQQLSVRDMGVTVNVGVVKGGTSRNTVAALAEALVDVRAPTLATYEAVLTGLDDAAEDLGIPGVHVELERLTMRQPMERSAASLALCEAYSECARRHGLGGGEAPRQGGGSDGNTTSAMGIPTIDALGPRGGGYHTPDEFIFVDTLVPRAAALAEWLLGR